MNGFKPTGYGPSAGFKFPASYGFTGSTGAYTSVAPYTRRKAFADGGFVRQDNPRMKTEDVGDTGSALQRRSRPTTQLDAESGGRAPLRPGFKRGGKLRKAKGGPVDTQAELEYLKAIHDDATPGQKYDDPSVTPAQVRRNMQRRADAITSPNHRIDLSTTGMRGYYGPEQPGGRDFEKTQRRTGHGPIKPPRMHSSKGHGPIKGIPGSGKALGTFADGGKVDRSGLSSLGRMKKSTATKPPMASIAKEKFAADGGRIARGSNAKPFLRSLADLPALVREVIRMGPYAVQDARRDVSDTKRRMMDRDLSRMETGYSRGGKMKRMGYASGGGVSRSEAKKIAQSTVGEHVKYPAPKGHKGLEKVMKR